METTALSRPERGVRSIAAVALLCALAVIAWQLIEGAGPDTTTTAMILVGVIASIALLYSRGFLALGERISKIDAFGIRIELRVQEAAEAIAQFQLLEDGAEPTTPDWPEESQAALRTIAEELRRKLRFSSEALLGEQPGISEEFIVKRLGLEGLLAFNEAELCRQIFRDLSKTLDELKPAPRKEFLDNAWAFAYRFATEMFDRQARRRLSAADWMVADFEQSGGHRRDFIAARPAIVTLIAARVAAPRGTAVEAAERLKGVEVPLPDLRRIVLVPDHTRHLWEKIDEGPMRAAEGVIVLRIDKLIADPGRANADPSALEQASA